jgi:hypothetical protein
VASRADVVATRGVQAVVAGRRGPSLAGAFRAALTDLYFHSWRLLPANVVWSVTAIAVLVAVILSPLAVAFLPVLAIPTAGLFRMTTRIARGDAVSFWDGASAWRTELPATLLLGAGLVFATLVLGVNVVTGLGSGTPLGWALATLAFWGIAAAWLFAWTAWPIAEDPRRATWPIRERLQLAATLVLAHPVRVGALGVALAVFLAASTVAVVALLMVSVAIAALVAARYVLPAADRLDDQLGFAHTRGLLPAATEPD